MESFGTRLANVRKEHNLTQNDIADKLHISAQAVSKWETGQGFPDVSLIEPLAKALDISVIELLSGEDIRNLNRSSNMTKGKFYVCPVCGNVINTTGEAVVSCCGITLPPLEPEVSDEEHNIKVELIEDEYYVTVDHPMTKEHYISFLAAVSDQGIQLTKLYPEGGCETRFKRSLVRKIYAYCNRHGLFMLKM